MPTMSGSEDLFLVTGGTGFLGSAIIRVLLDRGNRVRVLVRNNDAVMDRERNVEMSLGSVTDKQSVEVGAPVGHAPSFAFHRADA